MKLAKSEIKDILKNQLVFGGMIIFISGLIVNISNYFYRIMMGRMLGPELFGELVTIISLVLILSTLATPFQNTVARFSAIYQAKAILPNIKKIFSYLFLMGAIGGVILLGVGIGYRDLFVDFLNLSSVRNFYFLLLIIFANIMTSLGRGVLHGLQRFSLLGVGQVVNSLGRLALGVALVFLGFKLSGALGGFLLAVLVSCGLFLYFSRDVLVGEREKKEAPKIKKGEIWKYMGLSFLALLFLNILLNIDVVLVKHYFSAYETGIYSAFATLGRGVFLVGGMLGGIIFPVAAFRQEKGEDYMFPLKGILTISFFLLFFASLVLFLFPEFILKLFFGQEYLAGAHFLGYYGLIMAMLTVLWILGTFERSLNRFRFLYFLVLGSIIEILLISIWHSSFSQILIMFGVGVGIALLGTAFCIYFSESSRKKPFAA